MELFQNVTWLQMICAIVLFINLLILIGRLVGVYIYATKGSEKLIVGPYRIISKLDHREKLKNLGYKVRQKRHLFRPKTTLPPSDLD